MLKIKYNRKPMPPPIKNGEMAFVPPPMMPTKPFFSPLKGFCFAQIERTIPLTTAANTAFPNIPPTVPKNPPNTPPLA